MEDAQPPLVALPRAPSDREPACTCVWLPDEHGELLPQAWVSSHPEVRVVAEDGTVATGNTYGIDIALTPDGPRLFIEVDGHPESTIFELEDVVSCTPLSGITSMDELAEAISREIAKLLVDPGIEHRPLRLLIDDHAALNVELTYENLHCRPATRHDE